MVLTCKNCICNIVCPHIDDTDANRCQFYKNKERFAEVVRCKDCNQWKRNSGFVDSPNGHCFYHCIDTNGYDYCSYGAKMDGKGEEE